MNRGLFSFYRTELENRRSESGRAAAKGSRTTAHPGSPLAHLFFICIIPARSRLEVMRLFKAPEHLGKFLAHPHRWERVHRHFHPVRNLLLIMYDSPISVESTYVISNGIHSYKPTTLCWNVHTYSCNQQQFLLVLIRTVRIIPVRDP